MGSLQEEVSEARDVGCGGASSSSGGGHAAPVVADHVGEPAALLDHVSGHAAPLDQVGGHAAPLDHVGGHAAPLDDDDHHMPSESPAGEGDQPPTKTDAAKTTLKRDFKDLKQRMHDGMGNLRGAASSMAGMAMLERASQVTGDQLLGKFLKISLSSARTRREVGSAAAAEVAQALLTKHSKPVVEPILADVGKLGARVARQVAEATRDVLFGYLRDTLLALRRSALWVLVSCDEVLTAVTGPLISRWNVPKGSWEAVAIRGALMLVMLASLCSLYPLTSSGFRIGIVCGGLAGLLSSASYWRHRDLRARRAHVLSSEWIEGGWGSDCLAYFRTASEDTVGTDGRLVHHGLMWLNTLLATVWPKLAKHFGLFLQTTINDLVAHFKPSLVSSLEIMACDLGNLPIDVRRMHMNRTTESEIDFDVAIMWNGQVSIDLMIEVQGVRFFTQIRHLHFKGDFQVKAAPLVPVFPGFAGVAISLIKPPELDFKVSFKQVFTPNVIVTWLKRFILETIDDLLLWPGRIVIPLLDEEHPRVGHYMQRMLCHAVGIVRVEVIAAEGLDKADVRGSDPYVLVDTSRSEFRVTRTVHGTQSPVWDETCYLRVFEVLRALHIEIWDEDSTSADDLLGRCCVQLSSLKPGRPYDRWHNLGMGPFHSIEGCGAGFGRIRLRMTWWPMEELLANTGINVVDTTSKNYEPEQVPVVQRGCVFAQVLRCSELPLDSDDDEYIAKICCGTESYTSIGCKPEQGTMDLCFSAQFYDVRVTGEVAFKVLRRSKPTAAPTLLGVMTVPLAVPAASLNGVLEGLYQTASQRRHRVAVKVQWLPLDGAPLPFPPTNPTTHGCLAVFLEKASDLINADVVGLSDPFVKLTVGQHKARTQCKHETLHPVWNERFEFVDVSEEDTLWLRVRDQDAGTSDSLGELRLPMTEVARTCMMHAEGFWRGTWHLQGVRSGAISMRLHWNPGHLFTDADLPEVWRSARAALCEQEVGELSCTSCKLQKALELPHWRELPGIVWEEILESDKTESATTERPAPSDPLCQYMPNWSVLVVIHAVYAQDIEKGQGGQDWGSSVAHQAASSMTAAAAPPPSLNDDPVRMHYVSLTARGLSYTRLWTVDTDAVGLEWSRVPPDFNDVLVVDVCSATSEGDSMTGKLTIPLLAVWTARGRYMNGRFRLSSNGSAAFVVEFELAWVRSRATVHAPPALATPPRTLEAVTFSEVGALYVKLVSARGLRVADRNGSSDPFCVLQIGSRRCVSTTKFKTLNPVWDEKFTFPNIAQSSVLRVKVYDKDALRNDFLGEVHIPVHSVAAAGDGKLQSAFRLKGHQATGAIFLQLRWERNAADSPMASGKGKPGALADRRDSSPSYAVSATTAPTPHADRMGKLTVIVDAGHDLVGMDRHGSSSDPFCTLKVADQRHVTSVKKKTLNPEWGERFVFENVSTADCLRINVWDEDLMSKDRMGTAVVAVAELLSESLQKHRLLVALNGSPAGHLIIRASWEEEDFSMEAKAIFMQCSSDFDAGTPPATQTPPERWTEGEGLPSDNAAASPSSHSCDVSGVTDVDKRSTPASATTASGGAGTSSEEMLSPTRSLSREGVMLLHCEWKGVTGLMPSRSVRRLFVAFKVGHERRVTEILQLRPACTELSTSLAYWLPIVAEDRSQEPFVLRARLYERLPVRKVKRMIAEARIPLDCIIQQKRQTPFSVTQLMTSRKTWNPENPAILLDMWTA